jgi:hypothetical protein
MGPSDTSENFVPAGLASLGIEADEIEMAVMNAAHSVYWPGVRELLSADLQAVAPEPLQDVSGPPPS